MAETSPESLAARADAAMYALREDMLGAEAEAQAVLEASADGASFAARHPLLLRARAIAGVTLASIAHARSQLVAARPVIDRAVEAARKANDDDAIARSLRVLSHNHRAAGRPLSALQCLNNAYAAARRAGGERLITTLMLDVALARSTVGLHAEGLELLDEVERRYDQEKRGRPELSAIILGADRALMLRRLGRYAEAVSHLEERLERSGIDEGHYYVLYGRAVVAPIRREGEDTYDVEALERWRDLAAEQDLVSTCAAFELELAHSFSKKAPKRALEHLDRFDGYELTDVEFDDRVASLALRAAIHEEAGELDAANAALHRRIELHESLRASDASGAAFLALDDQVRELREAHAEQEERAGRLTRIVDELGSLHASVETMVQDAVHDIRGPLTALEMASAALHDEAPTDTLAHVQSAVEMIADVVSNLAGERRHGAASGDRHVDVGRMLQSTAATYRALASQKGSTLRIECEGDLSAAGDATHVRRLVGNLVSNAVKFSPPGAEIRVSARRRLMHVELCIRDEGPGFPAEMSSLFERGATGASPTADETSTGLGLDIVQRMAKRLGATLAFENVAGGGLVRIEFRAA